MVQNNSRVFVLNVTEKDMTDAKKYGILIPITEGNVDVFNLERLSYTIKDELQKYNFDNEKDNLLLSGGLPLNFILGNITSKYKSVWVLLWDAKNRKYIRKEYKP